MATTNPTPYTLASLQEKVKQAVEVLAALPDFFPGASPKDREPMLNEFVWNALAKLGIFQDDASHELLMSEDCGSGSILAELMNGDVPLARANRIVGILKPKADTSVAKTMVTLDPKDKPVGQWPDRMLVEELNPGHDQTDEAALALDNKVSGRPFVVYEDEVAGTVDIPTTMKMLVLAKRGKTPVHFSVGDSLRKLYRAIEPPNVVFFQCPLHPGTLLMEDYCDECGHNWSKIATEALQFVRLIQEADEAPEKAPAVRALIKLASEGVAALSDEYPKVAVEFKECKADGTLPNLRQRASQGRAYSDPMNPGKRF